MNKTQLLYVENVINRIDGKVEQQLTFFAQVENIGYDKQIDIFWSGETEGWHTFPLQFHSIQGRNTEYWQAQLTFSLTEQESLPGNILCALRYQVNNQQYWDNKQGQNYSIEADAGVVLIQSQHIQNVGFSHNLSDGQKAVPLTIAVAQSFNANRVTIHWTTDQWQTTQTTDCSYSRKHWDLRCHSNARNPNQYGCQLWTGQIENGDSFELEYIVSCENNEQTLWENNDNQNYLLKREKLKILILNLHCYQEENQDDKFSKIAQAVDELDVDIICLQEVAEYWRDGEGDWESNSAKIINDRLGKPFYLHTDWSHIGFDKYKEGVAILSRYPLFNHDAMYVSDSHDIYSIHSRKVVMAQVHIPYIGIINVFSAHLSWVEDGFVEQFQRLHEWAEVKNNESVKATLLCGDFNITAGTDGYQQVVESTLYEDQFLAANNQGVFEKIFRVNDAHWQDLLAEDYRIDYIFMNKNSALQVKSAELVFTDQDYGQVSDHCGYFMTFEPKTIDLEEFKNQHAEVEHANC